MSNPQIRGPRLLTTSLPGNTYRGNWRGRLNRGNVKIREKRADAVLETLVDTCNLKVAGGPCFLRDYLEGKEAVAGISTKTKAKLLTYGGLGAAGAATAYGAFKGWQSGQAEINNSLKQGFNPQSVY